jgi:hypothetical protein
MFCCVRVCSLVARERINQYAPNFARLSIWNNEEILESKHSESVLSSNLGEDGFCSLKSKHGRRTTPTPKLFVSVRELEDNGYNPKKSPGFESR